MPQNRRNSSVLCNGISANRLEDWRRSFRQQKRTSMLDMNSIVKQKPLDHADTEHLDPPQPSKILYPIADPSCSFDENFTNQLVEIGGLYEFVDSKSAFLGQGAYGDVMKGKFLDIGRSRPVAIKRMAQINVKPNELEAMKRVQNPFLVTLIDICQDSHNLNTYIVMELCDTDLDKYLSTHTKDGFLSRSDYDTVMRNIAFGYYALFNENIVHRDIKTQNILLLLSPNGNGIQIAKLTDFGVCRILEDSDGKLTNIAGTLGYLSPEIGANILTSREYGNSVDMWSIGVLLYECVTGHLPFDESSLCRIFLNCACYNFEGYSPPDLPLDTPESDVSLIQSLLEIDPEKRLTPQKLYSAALESMRRDENHPTN